MYHVTLNPAVSVGEHYHTKFTGNCWVNDLDVDVWHLISTRFVLFLEWNKLALNNTSYLASAHNINQTYKLPSKHRDIKGRKSQQLAEDVNINRPAFLTLATICHACLDRVSRENSKYFASAAHAVWRVLGSRLSLRYRLHRESES